MDNKFGKFIGSIMYGFSAMCIMACVMGYPVMWFWNYTMPEIFGLPEVDFLHALALNVLSGALFGKNSGYSPRKKIVVKKKDDDSDGKD